MRRILTGLVALALSFTMVGPALAGADVTNFQVRTYGAEAWLSNWSPDGPPGLYYDAYVQAFVAQDSRPGKSIDWVYFGYGVWEKLPNGDWVEREGASGYAPDGAAGLDMSVGDLDSATVDASVPVGYCREYAPEDQGGECIDYVDVGTVHLDLAWTPTSHLLSWTRTDHMVAPGNWLSTGRRTSHYREASLAGQVTFPGLGMQEVASQDGYITRYGIGSHDVTVMPGPFAPPFVSSLPR